MSSESADPPTADASRLSALVPLGDVLPEGSPDPREALPLFLQILRCVQGYQNAGHPHAELTPRHIRIRQNGDIEIDPGDPGSVGPQPIREAKYAAPEALTDPRSRQELRDIYSLGFLFYEVLLGTERFSAEFAPVLREASDFQWLKWHGNVDLRARALKEVRPDCPTVLSDLIERMMEKRADMRAGRLADVLRILEELSRRLEAGEPLDGVAVAAPAEKPPEPAPRRVASRNWGLGLGLAGALVIAVMLLGRGKDTGVSAKVPARPTAPAAASGILQSIETPTGPMELIPEQPAFYMDKFEVSNAAYMRFCDVTSRPRPAPPAWDRRYLDKPDHPVAGVSWEDARAFAQWAGKRLPSRTEWEKAASGEDRRLYPWGNWYEPGTANLADAKRRSPVPVGWFAFDFSPYGVQDMGGNVSEWVGNEAGVVRGGSFRSTPEEAKVSHAGSAPGKDAVGFRCAVDVKGGLALRVVEPK